MGRRPDGGVVVVAGDPGAGAIRGSRVNVGDPSMGQVAVPARTPRCVGSGHLLSIAAPTVSATGLPGVVGPGAGPGTGAGDHMTSIRTAAWYIGLFA